MRKRKPEAKAKERPKRHHKGKSSVERLSQHMANALNDRKEAAAAGKRHSMGGVAGAASIAAHAHHGGKMNLKMAYSMLDENGDGSLDSEEFHHACKAAPDDADCARLFALLDEDGGGTLDCTEIAHALRTNPEAKALAEKYESLHDLCRLSAVRKRRASSSGMSRRERARSARKRRKSRGSLRRKKTQSPKEMADALKDSD